MDEPIDLAQKAAEKGNPWFGLGNMLTGTVAGSASGTLTLADIEALKERMFDNDVQAESGMISLADLQALQEKMFHTARAEPAFLIHPKRMHWLRRVYAQGQRFERWQKIRKRQRRAAQRRHARGE